MHRAFNLTDYDWSEISRASGDVIFKRNSDIVKESLEGFLNGEIVDGTKLSDHWFPAVKADVFISHSHKDEELAIKCAGWLKDGFNLDAFIDSCVWGQADKLLRIIDNKYCPNPEGQTNNYDYEKRNRSTSHVHMMLSTALSRMLDATECVIFIKSNNSITSCEAVDKTESPWLFFELSTMRIIRRKKPARLVTQIRNFTNESLEIIKASEFKAEYEVPLSELTPLTRTQLISWMKAYKSNRRVNALDLLYEDIAPKED
jgi:hypothetical protein